MKNLLFTCLAIGIWSCHVTKKTTSKDQVRFKSYIPLAYFRGDTSAYLIKNFVKNQQDYLKKPLAELFKKSEVPVIDYIPLFGGYTQEFTIGVSLNFYRKNILYLKIKQHKKPAQLVIYLSRFPRKPATELLKTYNGKFSDSVKAFYGTRIIDSINFVHYPLN